MPEAHFIASSGIHVQMTGLELQSVAKLTYFAGRPIKYVK
jgi:hypothetical protein